MHHNVRGLLNKLNEFKLHLKINNPDIVNITETGPGLDNIMIPNYEISITKNKNGIRVAILLKTNVNKIVEEWIDMIFFTTNVLKNLNISKYFQYFLKWFSNLNSTINSVQVTRIENIF